MRPRQRSVKTGSLGGRRASCGGESPDLAGRAATESRGYRSEGKAPALATLRSVLGLAVEAAIAPGG
jgi:hypothetical protein